MAANSQANNRSVRPALSAVAANQRPPNSRNSAPVSHTTGIWVSPRSNLSMVMRFFSTAVLLDEHGPSSREKRSYRQSPTDRSTNVRLVVRDPHGPHTTIPSRDHGA